MSSAYVRVSLKDLDDYVKHKYLDQHSDKERDL